MLTVSNRGACLRCGCMGSQSMATGVELMQRPLPEVNVPPDTAPREPPVPLDGRRAGSNSGGAGDTRPLAGGCEPVEAAADALPTHGGEGRAELGEAAAAVRCLAGALGEFGASDGGVGLGPAAAGAGPTGAPAADLR